MILVNEEVKSNHWENLFKSIGETSNNVFVLTTICQKQKICYAGSIDTYYSLSSFPDEVIVKDNKQKLTQVRLHSDNPRIIKAGLF